MSTFHFKFRLATLLRLRETARDERSVELAEARRAEESIQKQIAYVAHELNSVQAEYRRAVGPGIVDLDRLAEAGRWEFALRARQEKLRQQLEAAAAEIERRQREFADAHRDVRVLENLRKRWAGQHRRVNARQAAKQLDEVAQRCFLHKESQLKA